MLSENASRRTGFTTICGGLLVLSGCGGKEPAPAAATSPATAPAAAPVAAPVAAAQTAPTAAQRSTATKWIGGIPYDVFYDRPLEVASDQTPLAGAAVPAVASTATPAAAAPTAQPMSAAATGAAPSAAPTAGGAPIDWAVIAPMEVIADEITSLRNDLTGKLNTLATYNQNWENIGVDATELAALAGVVERHPADVSWKANAKIARSLAADINSNAAKTGRSAYDATKAPFDSLVDLLNGNAPSDVQADDQAPFGDFADRGVLMAKLESNLNYAKSNITTQQRLEENPAEIKRRMTVLATLMTIVSTESYDSTADEDYKGFVKTFVGAALQGRDAVDAKDLATFTNAVNEMQKTCNECHLKYAFGGDSF